MTGLRHPTGSDVATEAADWYARLRAPDLSELDATRFRAWLAGDPERRREFEAIDALWNDISAIETSPEVRRVRDEFARRRQRAHRARYRTTWALAASLLLVIGGFVFGWQHLGSNRYVTEVGEQRTVPLPDGSVVMLNTDTELRLRYSETKRAVELVRGQANFEVVKDPARPFIVAAGDVQVRAVGTVFDVYRASDRVTVTLIEGAVAVTHQGVPAADTSRPVPTGDATEQSASRAASPIVLAAGEQVSYDPSRISLEEAVPADVPRVTAWRRRKLDFDDTPVLEAIAEANRYSREQIVLAAPALASARISGTFEAGKNAEFAEGLQSYFRLQLDRTQDDKIILSAR